MLLPNYDLAERTAREQVRSSLREAETYRLLRRAGLGQEGRVSYQVCRLLSGLGHLLVALGQRLERYEVSSAAPR